MIGHALSAVVFRPVVAGVITLLLCCWSWLAASARSLGLAALVAGFSAGWALALLTHITSLTGRG